MRIIRLRRGHEHEAHFQEYLGSGLVDRSVQGQEKWRWQYAQNPFSRGEYLPVWTCVSDGKTIGQLGAIPLELHVGASTIHGAWAVDFRVLPEYRGKGVGKLLVKEANQHFDAFLAIGATDMSFGLFTTEGWKAVGSLPYYVKIWNADAVLRDKVESSFLARLASVPLNVGFKFLDYVKAPRRSGSIDVHSMDGFGDEADRWWDEIRGSYDVVVSKTRAYLEWKYDRQPGMNYVKFRATRDGELCGYIVVRVVDRGQHTREGLIADVVVDPRDEEAIQSLTHEALTYLRRAPCYIARCYASQEHVSRMLVRNGFLKRKPQMRFLVNKNVDGCDAVESMGAWCLAAGDSDMDRWEA
jgi:GNAT superfamily N-acetyltransferase